MTPMELNQDHYSEDHLDLELLESAIEHAHLKNLQRLWVLNECKQAEKLTSVLFDIFANVIISEHSVLNAILLLYVVIIWNRFAKTTVTIVMHAYAT